MGHHTEAFVGIDMSKLRNAIAIADSGRGGEVRYVGEIPATETATRKLAWMRASKVSPARLRRSPAKISTASGL
jgi:transposase